MKAAKVIVLLAISALSIFAIFMHEPIPQSVGYHNFADRRTILGIPNCCDVVSNLPFLIIGLLGLYRLLIEKSAKLDAEMRPAYTVFFVGIFLVNFGSMHYHLNPNHATLAWDRLPITVAFTAFFAALIGEFISLRAGRLMLWPLVGYGVFSVAYWHVTEQAGAGDMRPYILVQALPIGLIPLIVLMFPARFSRRFDILGVLGLYIVAKALEFLDRPIFELTGLISGHSLKHLVAAVGAYWVLRMLMQREKSF